VESVERTVVKGRVFILEVCPPSSVETGVGLDEELEASIQSLFFLSLKTVSFHLRIPPDDPPRCFPYVAILALLKVA
jgi:hypothetical protein